MDEKKMGPIAQIANAFAQLNDDEKERLLTLCKKSVDGLNFESFVNSIPVDITLNEDGANN